jgi:hypothetical protein
MAVSVDFEWLKRISRHWSTKSADLISFVSFVFITQRPLTQRVIIKISGVQRFLIAFVLNPSSTGS